MSKPHFQIAIVGSGFAGSLMAMMTHRLGFSTVLIERGRHPRFAIGESSTPLANLLLEEISVAYDLPFVRPLCKWGSWQKQLPQLACGLKRGFTFYHHKFGKPFSAERGPATRSGSDGLETNGQTESSLRAEVLRVTDPRSGKKTESWLSAKTRNRVAVGNFFADVDPG